MRVLVMGAGAVGCLFGEALARVGCDVTFVARGAQLSALRERGLEVRGGRKTQTLRHPRIVATPAEAGVSFDLALFTVKTYDTLPAARCLLPALGPLTAVLTLQSGIDSAEEVGGIVGRERMLLGTVLVSVRLPAPGVIVQSSPNRQVTVGELSGEATERVKMVASALEEAGFAVTLSADPRMAAWEKLIVLAPHATLTSVCGLTLGEIWDTHEGLALNRQLVEEAVAVARASGVALPADAEARAMVLLMGCCSEARSSMAIDFEARRRVELEAITGAVVRRGHEARVPTPGFDALYQVLKVRALVFGGLTPQA